MADEDHTEIAGIPVQVVSEEEAEKSTYLVCVRWDSTPALFTDDVKGTCCACGTAVRFRPSAPKTPPRLCVECMLDMKGGLAQ